MIFVGAAIAVGVLVHGSGNKDNTVASLPLVSDAPRILKKATFGCSKQDDLERLTRLVAQKDNAAVLALETTLTADGSCKLFDVGMAVYVTDVSVWHNQMQIRAKGDFEPYWAWPAALGGEDSPAAAP